MKLISWNVNGLRAAITKGFSEFFEKEDADIFCIQETKMQPGQAEINFEGYKQYWNSAVKKGYSGTAIFTNSLSQKGKRKKTASFARCLFSVGVLPAVNLSKS